MTKSFEKEVYYDRYCKLCVNKEKDGAEEPCKECLDHTVNIYCRKPVNFKEDFDN